MAHVVDGVLANFEVHFLHSDDPRHGFCIMSMNPLVWYDFQTPIGLLATHTMVTDGNGATIVTFNWFGLFALGTMTWPGPPAHETHMGDLVMPCDRMEDSREFRSEGPDGVMRTFWWHHLQNGEYDLYTTRDDDSNMIIGEFRRHQPPELLPVGDNYATLSFLFEPEPLLLHALLALSLNRWLDFQPGPQ